MVDNLYEKEIVNGTYSFLMSRPIKAAENKNKTEVFRSVVYCSTAPALPLYLESF